MPVLHFVVFRKIPLTNSTATSTIGIANHKLLPSNIRGNVRIAMLLRIIFRSSEVNRDFLALKTDCK